MRAASREESTALRAKLHAAIRKGKALEKEKLRLEKALASASADALPASAPASPDINALLTPGLVSAQSSPYFTPSNDSPALPSPEGTSGEAASAHEGMRARNLSVANSPGGRRTESVSPSKTRARTGNGHLGADLVLDAERAAGLEEQLDAMRGWLSKAESIKLERRATQAEANAVRWKVVICACVCV